MKNHENWINLQKIALLLLLLATKCFLHKTDDIFMVHVGKIKWPFYELLAAMVTHEGCLVGKLLPRVYLPSWRSVNIFFLFREMYIIHDLNKSPSPYR